MTRYVFLFTPAHALINGWTNLSKKVPMRLTVAVYGLLLCLLSPALMAQQVSVNYDHSRSFAGYHTYAWGSNNANQIQNSILAQVARQDIDAAMQGKGLQTVAENQNPDLILTASGGMQQVTSYTAWRTGWGTATITPEQNVVGTLIVDLYDAKAQALVWRGIAQDTLSEKGNKNQEIVGKAVRKMFKQWPK